MHRAQNVHPNRNYIGIWVHDPFTPSLDINQLVLKHLNSTFDYVREFDTLRDIATYLREDQLIASVVVIISSEFMTSPLQELLAQQINNKSEKIRATYSLPINQAGSKREISLQIDTLCLQIQKDLQVDSSSASTSQTEIIPEMSDQSIPPFGVANHPLKQTSIRCLSNESRRFIQFQALIEILFCLEHDVTRAKDDMLCTSRIFYADNVVELVKIAEFERSYNSKDVHTFYTKDGFCFRMVNMAFRTEDIEQIYTWRLFISDLHKKLKEIFSDKKQKGENTLTVYRGKKLRHVVIQQLKDNVNKRISMNGFLSTSLNKNAAIFFSGDDVPRDKHESVVFEIHIDDIKSYTGKPFADISTNNEEMDEQEVLFSAGTVWKITDIKMEQGRWHVSLHSCSEDLDRELDRHLDQLTDGYTLLSVGKSLEELEEYDKAEKFYSRMLRDKSNITKEQESLLNYRIGRLRQKKGDENGALDYFEKALAYFPTHQTIQEKVISLKLPTRFEIYAQIGLIHCQNRNLSEANEAWQNALLEPDGTPQEKANVYNYLGDLAKKRGNLDQAIIYYKDAQELGPTNELKRKYDEALDLNNRIHSAESQKRRRT
ncbi:unnamed protein product [Adineta ricciae]|uniref:NAD(P)(+)--arginine ADP-ribosyltransferase n=1 Tax=Adineta ricciae TaxID=249248 RepID=A0A814TBC8_ADIRI|nr:unnamed protein product [Adineta ricciae]CAF1437162.1 unnamed protein product [Adineta ricciae]